MARVYWGKTMQANEEGDVVKSFIDRARFAFMISPQITSASIFVSMENKIDTK